MLTSYTRAAASVLRGRIEVPEEQVATLHALAYRALGKPPLAEKGPLAKRWNEAHAHQPAWQVGGHDVAEDGLSAPDAETGEMLRMYSLARGSLASPDHPLWNMSAEFAREWEAWKYETGSVDFADMLIEAATWSPAVGHPIFIVDEAQDLVPLQWALVRQWGAAAARFIVAGDPAQTLYQFAGASPQEMLAPLPDERLWPLAQSYRVPAAVHEFAETYLTRHSGLLTAERTYAPKAGSPGTLGQCDASWRNVDELLPALERRLADGKSCMVLASCSYMLAPLVAALRAAGLPFGNAHRRSNGAWNPLAARTSPDGKEAPARTADKVAAYVRGEPAVEWVELLRADAFRLRSAKKMIVEGGEPVEELIRPEYATCLAARDLSLLRDHALAKYTGPLAYASTVIERHGVSAVEHEPLLTVGTIHAVKGAEADCVFIFPDTSQAGWVEAVSSPAGHDAMVRLAYVGFTRAADELVLCAAADPRRTMW